MRQNVFSIDAWSIQLWQDADGQFTVRYGTQLWPALDYSEASRKLGEAIMHALSCDGKIANQED